MPRPRCGYYCCHHHDCYCRVVVAEAVGVRLPHAAPCRDFPISRRACRLHRCDYCCCCCCFDDYYCCCDCCSCVVGPSRWMWRWTRQSIGMSWGCVERKQKAKEETWYEESISIAQSTIYPVTFQRVRSAATANHRITHHCCCVVWNERSSWRYRPPPPYTKCAAGTNPEAVQAADSTVSNTTAK